jgi:hypothetical protein
MRVISTALRGPFVLEPIDALTTRLLVRAVATRRRSVGVMLHLIWRPMHFAVQRKQLLILRKRIETGVGYRFSELTRPHWEVVDAARHDAPA